VARGPAVSTRAVDQIDSMCKTAKSWPGWGVTCPLEAVPSTDPSFVRSVSVPCDTGKGAPASAQNSTCPVTSPKSASGAWNVNVENPKQFGTEASNVHGVRGNIPANANILTDEDVVDVGCGVPVAVSARTLFTVGADHTSPALTAAPRSSRRRSMSRP
jgi:hypothetical protein